MTTAMGMRRLFLLVFILYVVLDLGCPLVPGAFSFEPADSVDAVSADRTRPPALPRVAVPAPAMAAVPLLVPSGKRPPKPAEVPGFAVWCPHAARTQTLAADPRPSAEDD
jgi:hypothetical protein